ncbi:MAG: hypothetical protein ACPGUV_04355 [Polyangiales bacterium]
MSAYPAPIRIDDPRRSPERSVLDSGGGFAWWYVDLRDRRGSGLVLIWSFGLPFLPGYAAAARAGRPVRPRTRPSLNVAIYREGVLDGYLLQELDPQEAHWRTGEDGIEQHWSFGSSRMHFSCTGTQARLDVMLDCALPGQQTRLQGRVQVKGRLPHCSPQLRDAVWTDADHSPHHWTPMVAGARGQAYIEYGSDTPLDLRGSAYHDRNWSPLPLHALGIQDWLWGRVHGPHAELVYYALTPPDTQADPTHLVLELREDGELTWRPDVTLRLQGRRWARYGMPWWAALELWQGGRLLWRITHPDKVDDGPFYLRFLTQAQHVSGAVAPGVAEVIRPGRVDLVWQRPFVRMRVHQLHGPNSWLTAAFSGAQQGRLRRALAALVPGQASDAPALPQHAGL